MFKLRFLLGHYARPLYRILGVTALIGAGLATAAWLTAWFEPVAIVLAALVAALAAVAATLAILVVNVLLAASLKRSFDRFETTYDAWRRANGIPDPFYEEADRAEAAARSGVAA